MDDDLHNLPHGDLHWDGETLTAGGVVLEPGRYRIGDTESVLEVVPADDGPEYED